MPRFLTAAVLVTGLTAPPAIAIAQTAPQTTAAQTTAPQKSASQKSARTANVKLTYDVYAHGFHAMQMLAQIRLTAGGYSMVLSYHTTGMANMISRSQVVSVASGAFDGAGVVPAHFDSSGYARGANRHDKLDYHAGNPTVVISTPPEPDRDPVTAQQTAGSIDTLSAIVLMLRGVIEGHGCVERVKVFDGLRLSSAAATDAGDVQVASSGKSPFDGAAHKCDFIVNQIGGILHDSDEAKSRRPMHGTASIAVPRDSAITLPVPIRAGFENPTMGYATLYLVKAEALP